MIRFRYAPFRPDLDPARVIAVGGPPFGALHLSHWPGNGTPPAVKAETSLEIVLKFLSLKTAQREALRRGADLVTVSAFGVDAVLALWSLLFPHHAQGFTGPLQAAAYSGEFQVFVFPEATRLCCAIHRLGEPDRSPLPDEFRAADPWDRLGALINALLARMDDLLGYLDRFESEWQEEFERIQADRRLFAEGNVSIEEYPDVDLAVMRVPRAVHPVARNSATRRLRVLTIEGGGRYELTYRAESWADLPGRSILPRIDLASLVPQLQARESAGAWCWDGPAARTPRLCCVGPAGTPVPSEIPGDRFLALLLDFLRRHA